MFLPRFIKKEIFFNFIFVLPVIFWLILAIVNIEARNVYTKLKLIPLPIVIHAISVIGICFIYLFIFLLSPLKNIIFRTIIAFSFALLFMAVYEFFYWLFLITNLNFDVTQLSDVMTHNLLIKDNFTINQLPLKFFKFSILVIIILISFFWFLNRKINFLSTKKINIYFSLIIFIIFLTVMIILRQQGFFMKTLLWFKGLLPEDPHNLLWVFSKLLSMLMFLPLIKIRSKLN